MSRIKYSNTVTMEITGGGVSRVCCLTCPSREGSIRPSGEPHVGDLVPKIVFLCGSIVVFTKCRTMDFSLISLAFVTVIPLVTATISYETGYFEQKLDHFNFIVDVTFKQRYLYTGRVETVNCLVNLNK